MARAIRIEGSIDDRAARLRWKPVPGAKAYTIEWLDRHGDWWSMGLLEGEETAPNADGLIEWADEGGEGSGSGATYRVAAYFDEEMDGKPLLSAPVVLRSSFDARSARRDLQRRMVARKTPPRVRKLIERLKWTRDGWRMLLPKDAGVCLGKAIEVEIRRSTFDDRTLRLVTKILSNLPRLAARAEQAFHSHSEHADETETGKLRRPRVVIPASDDARSPQSWTMLIETMESGYAWHIEFVASRFREVWAGD